VSLGNYDQYFGGDATSWIRAANALRLKIASRLIKRSPTSAQTIAQEVLGESPEYLMSSNEESWQLKSTASFVSGGNWNPDGLFAPKPLVDFMWDYSDPRLDAIVAPNGYSQANIDVLISEGELDPGTTESPRRYFGSFTSPDAAASPANQRFYTPRTATIDGADTRI